MAAAPDDMDSVARTMLMNIHQAGAASSGSDTVAMEPAGSAGGQQEKLSTVECLQQKQEHYQNIAPNNLSSRGNGGNTAASTDTDSRQQHQRSSSGSKLDFADTIESILSSAERRKENSNASSAQQQHGGLLRDNEIYLLSMLCTQQTMASQERKTATAAASTSATAGVDVDLGFADVDVDLVSQLIEVLEHHVVSASRVSLIEGAYKESRNIQRRLQRQRAAAVDSSSSPKAQSYKTMDEWVRTDGSHLQKTMNVGLEAAAVLLFIMTSPCIDRRVVNEDAIVASMVLMKHSIGKNILPAVNETGHIVAAVAAATTVEERLTATPEQPNKKRRRSRSSLSTSEATTLKDMKKAYSTLVMQTVGYTVTLMERLEVLIKTIPMDENHLITCSAAALQALELDPSSHSSSKDAKACHHIHVAMVNIVTACFRKYPKVRGMIMEDLFPLMLRMPTGKKGSRLFPIQCSSVLYPYKALYLSKSLVQDSTFTTTSSATTPTTPPAQHQRQEYLYVQPLTVLIVSLVQSSVIKPTFMSANEGSSASSVINNNESGMTMNENDDNDDVSGNTEEICIPRITSGLGGCQGVSNLIVKLLIDRCTKKAEDGGASEFRPILSNLIDDLLSIMLVPEYPASEMILLSIVNTIAADIAQRSEKKLWKETETTYLSTVFDALGKICAAEGRIRKWNDEHPVRDLPVIHREEENVIDCYCENVDVGNKFVFSCERCLSYYHGECVGVTRGRFQNGWLCDGCQLGRIIEFEKVRNRNLGELGTPPELIDRPYIMRRLLIDYLSIVSSQDADSEEMGVEDAYCFHLARWLNELDSANSISSKGKNQRKKDAEVICRKNIIVGLLEMWDPKDSQFFSFRPPSGVSESLNGMLRCMSDEGRSRVIVDLICKLSSLLMSFQTQIGFLVKLMESSSSTIRKLALKAIEKVANADPKLMLYDFIRKAVIRRFGDESISVRDAAVSVVGSYVVHTPDVADHFHKAFLQGLGDPGISVRKRTICVLHDILTSNSRYEGQAEACSAMLRVASNRKEDDSVRDLVYDLFSQLWLEDGVVKHVAEESPAPERGTPVDTKFTPSSMVTNVEVAGETPEAESFKSETPTRWSTDRKSTRSTAKKNKSHLTLVRCEAAAEQMVEVVKVAKTAEDLEIMFREIFSDVADADKDRRASVRKKRQDLAKIRCRLLVDALFERLIEVDGEAGLTPEKRGRELVAIFRTIQVFTNVSPVDAKEHVDTMIPYFKADAGLDRYDESEIARALCTILSQMIPGMDSEDIVTLADPLKSLSTDLENITKKSGPQAVQAAVKALCLLSDHQQAPKKNVFAEKLLQMARSYYYYLTSHKDSDTFKNRARDNVKRALGIMGAICQFCASSSFHDSDIMDDDESTDEVLVSTNVTLKNVAPLCEKLFTVFLSKNDTQVKCTALKGLTGIFTAHPREMLRMDQSGLIESVMSKKAPLELQQTALRCWREILLAEESRVESGEAKAKMDAKKDITMSKKISGDQDADATIFGGILTCHVKRLFTMTYSRDLGIRQSAVDLIGTLLSQGQVNPNDTVPVLLALQGDLVASVRLHALKLLMQEAERRPDMLIQRLRQGIKRAFFFQKVVYPNNNGASALITLQQEDGVRTECVFGSVYKECISSNKKHRTALFRDLVHSFDPQTLERGDRKTATSASTPASKKSKGSDSGSRSDAAAPPVPDLELLSYTSQVLAFLPYAYPSDPLYIIHQIQQILSVQGPELVEAFASFLRPYGLADEDEYGDPLEGVDVIEEASTRPVPHHAKQVTVMLENAFDSLKFQNLCLQAGCLVLLLRLKQHLRHAYNLSETRCRHFDPQVKNSRESPIINKPSLSEFQSKLPLQNDSDPSSTNVLDGMIRMYAEFRKLMRSEIGSNSSGEESDSDNSNHDDTAMSKKKRRRSSAAGGGGGGGRCRRNVFDDENDDDDDDNNDGGDDE